MDVSLDPTDLQKSMSFANALIKLKKARDTGTTATLTAHEATTVIDGLNLLRKGSNGNDSGRNCSL